MTQIKTERMTISISSDAEMKEIISEQTDEELKTAYGEMLSLCIGHPEMREWYAVWIARSHDGKNLGDLCFKGLSSDGETEIGYGFLPEYRGQGYATEAVCALVEWALKKPCVTKVFAETAPDNAASQRVLEKAGFVPTGEMGEEGPRFVQKR